jgi:3-dehydroquinate synthase
MQRLPLSIDGVACEVVIGPGTLSNVGTMAARDGRQRRALVVSDSTVAPLYGRAVVDSLVAAGAECRLAVVPAGEASKSPAQLAKLYDELAAFRVGRDGLLVAVGGGMVSDLTGFAAATWLRGVSFAICPTSLEAAVDAAIGGKTAVNHAAGKNLIGAFHQPSLVVIDPLCVQTLPRRDLVAGLAESIKHGLIADAAFVAWHEAQREGILARDPGVLEELIARNVAIKAGVVTQDPRERKGLRECLNFGHTVGHAIEASSTFAFRHGECVALGMVAAAHIARALGLLAGGADARIEALLAAFGLPIRYDQLPAYDVLAPYLASDKKVVGTQIRWVLLEGLGRTVIRSDVGEIVVRKALEALRGGGSAE